jgi:hypothetical protein
MIDNIWNKSTPSLTDSLFRQYPSMIPMSVIVYQISYNGYSYDEVPAMFVPDRTGFQKPNTPTFAKRGWIRHDRAILLMLISCRIS